MIYIVLISIRAKNNKPLNYWQKLVLFVLFYFHRFRNKYPLNTLRNSHIREKECKEIPSVDKGSTSSSHNCAHLRDKCTFFSCLLVCYKRKSLFLLKRFSKSIVNRKSVLNWLLPLKLNPSSGVKTILEDNRESFF